MKDRTSAGDNSHVNTKDFGKIAHSAQKDSPELRAHQRAIAQGDENQRENYNTVRTRDAKSLKLTNAYVGKDGKTYSGTIKSAFGSNSKGSKTLRAGGKGK